MSGERSLLRRLAPLLAVVALLAPAAARASSFSPDPPPGSKVLKPDPAPSAVPAAKPKVITAAKAVRPPTPVVRATPVETHTAPVHREKVKAAPPKPSPQPKAKRTLVVPALPPVLVPRFIEAPLSSDPPRALAALALALAALTALLGAGVVFSWSRR
jgi:hypothetical protein